MRWITKYRSPSNRQKNEPLAEPGELEQCAADSCVGTWVYRSDQKRVGDPDAFESTAKQPWPQRVQVQVRHAGSSGTSCLCRGFEPCGLAAQGLPDLPHFPAATDPSTRLVSTPPRLSFLSPGSIFALSPTATTMILAGTRYFFAAACAVAAVTAVTARQLRVVVEPQIVDVQARRVLPAVLALVSKSLGSDAHDRVLRERQLLRRHRRRRAIRAISLKISADRRRRDVGAHAGC